MNNELFHLNNLPSASLHRERLRVTGLLHQIVPAKYVHEVGSTAVPGVIGKQDLDFLVRVPAAEFDGVRAALDETFDRDPNQLSNAIYQGYKIPSELDVAIQLTISGGPHDTFLAFLESLRARAELRQAYNDLKRSFVGQPMAAYRRAKAEFIETALRKEH